MKAVVKRVRKCWVLHMCKSIKWLEPWSSLCVDPHYFEEEFYREAGEKHILYGKKVTAIGRRDDRDDILFYIDDFEYKYAVIHLTFSKHKEKDAVYPKARLFKNIGDWIENCMVIDNAEYV